MSTWHPRASKGIQGIQGIRGLAVPGSHGSSSTDRGPGRGVLGPRQCRSSPRRPLRRCWPTTRRGSSTASCSLIACRCNSFAAPGRRRAPTVRARVPGAAGGRPADAGARGRCGPPAPAGPGRSRSRPCCPAGFQRQSVSKRSGKSCRLQVAVFTRTESWKGVSFCTSMDMISGEAIIAQSENCAMDWSSVRLRFLLPCMYLAPALPSSRSAFGRLASKRPHNTPTLGGHCYQPRFARQGVL